MKASYNSINKQTSNPARRTGRGSNKAKEHTKGCTPASAAKRMKIKTTMSCHFTPVRLQLETGVRTGEDVEK